LRPQSSWASKVPTICLENLTEDQIRAYILADNRLAEKAGWDHSILAIELQHLIAVDLEFDVSITGFEVAEIDLILEEAAAEKGKEEEPVEISSGPAVTKPGDIWMLGNHRLICGDALDESTYSSLMNGQKADVVFSDPPYNVKIDGNVCGKGAIHHREFAMASGEMSESEFSDFLCRALSLLELTAGMAPFTSSAWIGGMQRRSFGWQESLRHAPQSLRLDERQWRHGFVLPVSA
jgi:hypothetical protein